MRCHHYQSDSRIYKILFYYRYNFFTSFSFSQYYFYPCFVELYHKRFHPSSFIIIILFVFVLFIFINSIVNFREIEKQILHFLLRLITETNTHTRAHTRTHTHARTHTRTHTQWFVCYNSNSRRTQIKPVPLHSLFLSESPFYIHFYQLHRKRLGRRTLEEKREINQLFRCIAFNGSEYSFQLE